MPSAVIAISPVTRAMNSRPVAVPLIGVPFAGAGSPIVAAVVVTAPGYER